MTPTFKFRPLRPVYPVRDPNLSNPGSRVRRGYFPKLVKLGPRYLVCKQVKRRYDKERYAVLRVPRYLQSAYR